MIDVNTVPMAGYGQPKRTKELAVDQQHIVDHPVADHIEPLDLLREGNGQRLGVGEPAFRPAEAAPQSFMA